MFLVKSKSRALKMREGAGGKMRDVGPLVWEMFEALPPNLSPPVDDGDMVVRVVNGDEDLKAADADNARALAAQVDADKARKDKADEASKAKAKAEDEAKAKAKVAAAEAKKEEKEAQPKSTMGAIKDAVKKKLQKEDKK